MYLNIAVYSQPEMPQFASLRTKAKTRELEIMKAMQSGTSVPPMSLTASMATSMAASQVFAPQPAGHYSPQPNQYQPPAQFSNELASQPEIGGNLPFVPQNYDTAPPSIPMVSQFQSGMSPFPLPNNNDNIMPPFPSPNNNDNRIPPFPSPTNSDTGMPPIPSPGSNIVSSNSSTSSSYDTVLSGVGYEYVY